MMFGKVLSALRMTRYFEKYKFINMYCHALKWNVHKGTYEGAIMAGVNNLHTKRAPDGAEQGKAPDSKHSGGIHYNER